MSYDEDDDFDLGEELAGMDDVATGSKLLPAEEYVWTVVDAKYKQAKTGTKGINVTLEIADGPYRGQRLFDDIWYSEKAITMFWGRLKKFGITSEWVRETGNTKLSQMADLIKGVTIVAEVFHDDYQGDERAKIKKYVKMIGENPNISDAESGPSASAAPAVASLPDLPEDPAPVGAAVGTATADDPWGTDA